VRDQKIEGAPSRVMEILSPSSRERDLIVTTALYVRTGVQEYWLVDPERETILVQALMNGVFTLVPIDNGIARSLVVPKCSVALSDIFATPEWNRSREAND